jgi:2-oxoisovalerate dehydrogenase E1 component alpha subunit
MGAVARARDGGGPTLLECMTYRFHPHTSDDDDRTYRSREEVEEAKAKDPLIQFGGYLKDNGLLDDEAETKLRTELKTGVDQEVDRAWDAPDPEAGSAVRHVFAEDPLEGERGQGATHTGGDDDEEQLENVSSEVSPTLEDDTGG